MLKRLKKKPYPQAMSHINEKNLFVDERTYEQTSFIKLPNKSYDGLDYQIEDLLKLSFNNVYLKVELRKDVFVLFGKFSLKYIDS